MGSTFDIREDHPLVSVLTITYNHAPYIRDCLEGIVSQQTNFPFELIVHDDASTDGTADIVREYSEKYPHIIVPILQEENQWSKLRTVAPFVLPKVRGRYQALCEGDDYWIDPHKLQKQVNYMEAHPECSACCTSAYRNTGISEQLEQGSHLQGDMPVLLTMEDVLEYNHIATCSMLFKTELVTRPEWARKLKQADWTQWVLCAGKGPIAWLPEFTAVRRVHPGGIWSSMQSAEVFQSGIDCYTCFRSHLPDQYHAQIDRKLAEVRFMKATALARAGVKLAEAWRLAWGSSAMALKNGSITQKRFFKTWLLLLFPVGFVKRCIHRQK
jgi:glycosyltransferase involved in cell wall biosynthesis